MNAREVASVLIVHDRFDLCADYVHAFTDQKWTALLVADPDSAWSRIAAGEIDVLVVAMEGTSANGMALAHRVKRDRRTSHLPLVVLDDLKHAGGGNLADADGTRLAVKAVGKALAASRPRIASAA